MYRSRILQANQGGSRWWRSSYNNRSNEQKIDPSVSKNRAKRLRTYTPSHMGMFKHYQFGGGGFKVNTLMRNRKGYVRGEQLAIATTVRPHEYYMGRQRGVNVEWLAPWMAENNTTNRGKEGTAVKTNKIVFGSDAIDVAIRELHELAVKSQLGRKAKKAVSTARQDGAAEQGEALGEEEDDVMISRVDLETALTRRNHGNERWRSMDEDTLGRVRQLCGILSTAALALEHRALLMLLDAVATFEMRFPALEASLVVATAEAMHRLSAEDVRTATRLCLRMCGSRSLSLGQHEDPRLGVYAQLSDLAPPFSSKLLLRLSNVGNRWRRFGCEDQLVELVHQGYRLAGDRFDPMMLSKVSGLGVPGDRPAASWRFLTEKLGFSAAEVQRWRDKQGWGSEKEDAKLRALRLLAISRVLEMAGAAAMPMLRDEAEAAQRALEAGNEEELRRLVYRRNSVMALTTELFDLGAELCDKGAARGDVVVAEAAARLLVASDWALVAMHPESEAAILGDKSHAAGAGESTGNGSELVVSSPRQTEGAIVRSGGSEKRPSPSRACVRCTVAAVKLIVATQPVVPSAVTSELVVALSSAIDPSSALVAVLGEDSEDVKLVMRLAKALERQQAAAAL